MEHQIIQVDAFTDGARLFTGNPAAVVVVPGGFLPAEVMQLIAMENNLAETAFVAPVDAAANHWFIRWFTPTTEVPLCGHATLAAAHALLTEVSGTAAPLRFSTVHSGELGVSRAEDGESLVLDFPSQPPPADDSMLSPETWLALGVDASQARAVRDGSYWLVHVASADIVRAAAPSMEALARACPKPIILTSAPDPARDPVHVDFISRFFAPGFGIPEDPVTGSAHCILTPYWAALLGKTALSARQVSARMGVLACEVAGARVRIAGRCRTFLRGHIASK